MEQLIASLLTGDLSTTSLLILFILGLLTKRFVPWWIYEDMQEKLDLYEKEAPALIQDVKNLLETMEERELEGETQQARRLYGTIHRLPKKGGSHVSSRSDS